MNGRPPMISVVVCCYSNERFGDLLAALESVRRQTLQPLELVVVVDHNPDLLNHARAYAPDVLSIGNSERQGLSGARNTGIAVAQGDIIAFLDDDAVAEPHWLQYLAARYGNPYVAGVGGEILPYWLKGRPRWFPHEFDWVVGCTYRGMPVDQGAVRNFIGANMSFRREVFETVGGFEAELGRIASYPLGNEETEFCIRARRALPGGILAYEPRARVHHRVPPSRASWRYFSARCYAEGLSKAALTRLSGSADGLASERVYAVRVLPRGVARGAAVALDGSDSLGVLRSLAITAGFFITVAGYLVGRLDTLANSRASRDAVNKPVLLAARAVTEILLLATAARGAIAARPRPRVAWRAVLPVAPVALALLLWTGSLGRIDLARINDFGLLPALPWMFYAALAVLTTSFSFVLQEAKTRQLLLAVHVVTLIVILHATPAIAYGTLRYAWAWKHVGIVDYIQRHGSVDPEIQFLTAYHNWPGFFGLSALYAEVAGLESALSFASWAPLFFNLLFFAALVVLFGTLTTDRRRLWLGIWFFFALNWVGQDYFSPQAFNYFLFLVLLAVCLAWFRPSQLPDEEAVRRFARSERLARWFQRAVRQADSDAQWHRSTGRTESAALAVLLILLAAVIASSHQLTPFMAALALGALVIFQRLRLRALPVLVLVMTLGWVSLFAVGFLRGNLYWVVDSIGALATNADSTLINLAEASSGQRAVAVIDRALTLGVWGLGGLGFARLLWHRRLDLSAGILALSPFGMLAANAYGGEILFRVYFFSLPFFALLAAGLFYPRLTAGKSRLTGAATALVSAAMLAGLLFGYYGKERQNYFTPAEVHAAHLLYTGAEPGSLLVSGANNYPWAFENYERYTYLALADLLPDDRREAIAMSARTIAEIARNDEVPCAYVVITSSEKAAIDMTGVMPAGSLTRIERALAASPAYRVALRNASATIFALQVEETPSRCRLDS